MGCELGRPWGSLWGVRLFAEVRPENVERFLMFYLLIAHTSKGRRPDLIAL